MSSSKYNFRHESLQDCKSIQNILKAISKGLAKGELSFSDEDGEICLQPEGLLNLKVTARQEDNQNRVNIRITWVSDDQEITSKALKVNQDD